jgi:hypothetical protein
MIDYLLIIREQKLIYNNDIPIKNSNHPFSSTQIVIKDKVPILLGIANANHPNMLGLLSIATNLNGCLGVRT